MKTWAACMRWRIAAAVALALMLAGCAAQKPQTIATPVTVEVPVPTPVYCPAPHLPHPALGLSALKPDSPPADTMRAYAAAVAVLEGAVSERDDVIAGCTRPLESDGGQGRPPREEQAQPPEWDGGQGRPPQ
jgi:hypothetical protein